MSLGGGLLNRSFRAALNQLEKAKGIVVVSGNKGKDVPTGTLNKIM